MIDKKVVKKSECSKITCVFTNVKYKNFFISSLNSNEWNILFESSQVIFAVGKVESFVSLADNQSLIGDSLIFSIPEVDLNNKIRIFKILLNTFFLTPDINNICSNQSELWKEILYKMLDDINSSLGKMDSEELINKINIIFDLEYGYKKATSVLKLCLYTEFMRLYIRYKSYIESDSYLIKKYRLVLMTHYSEFEEWKSHFFDFLVYLNELIKLMESKNLFTKNLLEYLEHNYMKGINMAVIANEYDLNYAYFSHKFRDCFGEKFSTYLKNYRIEKAKLLLKDSCFTMSEVAKNTGFNDTKYFFKAFKQITGITPGEYKKKYMF